MKLTPVRQLWLTFFIYLIGLSYMLFAVEREDTAVVLGMYGLLTVCYFGIASSKIGIRSIANMAIAFRLVAWIAFPELSDDIYRFIWDGRLILDGVNPYLFTPTEFLASNFEEPYESLFPMLNSSGYYSVYPIVIQCFSAFGALAANDPYLASLIIKLPILIGELGTLWILPQILSKLKLDPRLYKLYALHPLVIIELCGNAHFEGLMIFFTVLSVRWLLVGKHWFAGIALALGVATKLIPLLFFPFLWKALKWNARWRFAAAFGISCLVLFAPLLHPTFIEHFGKSIDLYFRSFEFNASIYYVLRTIGFLMVEYNAIAWIGPGMLIATCAILGYLWLQQDQDLKDALLKAVIGLSAYYVLSTTVHPWYLTMLLLLSPIFKKPYMIVWPTVAFLSYSAYGNPAFKENNWILALEYGLVLASIIWESALKKRFSPTLQ